MVILSNEEAGLISNCDNIQECSQLVKKCLYQDRECADLSHKLQISSIYSGSCSGMQDSDYPTSNIPSLPLVTQVKRVPLPPELIEQFAHMQCNCLIGVFASIKRAWLTIDSDIFLWRYEQGDDLAYFAGLNETILSVALVTPKEGIFRDHVKYLLVLTTPLDIVILGVSFTENDPTKEMHLVPDPLFTLPTDSTYLMQTMGTSSGRIFTGGKDGCLYEVDYHANGSWFRSNCQKINHSRSSLSFLIPSAVSQFWINENDAIAQVTCDETRNVLYTRSEKGTIAVYDLGEDGTGLRRVSQMHLDAIRKKARNIANGIEPSNLSEIVDISPVTLQESRHIDLVAITQSGIRIYFVVTSASFQSTTLTPSGGNRPTGLHLVHVRLPPGFTNSSVQRPTSVHAAYYRSGSLLLASTSGDDAVLWFVNGDMFAFDKQLKENQTSFPLDGRSWAISEAPSPSSDLTIARLPRASSQGIPPDPPVHVLQHLQQPSEYIIVTSQGCHIFYKLRPVDQLRYLLETTTDPDSAGIEAFFKLYNEGEAVCCCIILATSNMATDKRVSDRAISLFLQFGGINVDSLLPALTRSNQATGDTINYSSFPPPLSPIHSSTMSDHRHSGPLTFSTPLQTRTRQRPTIESPQLQTGSVSFYSDRQQGLFKIFSRIVRPIWEGTIIEDYFVTESGKKRSFAVSRIELNAVVSIIEALKNLKQFMSKYCLVPAHVKDVNQTLMRGLHRNPNHSPTSSHQVELQKKYCAEASAAELGFINQLYKLIDVTIQVLGLWRLILHHRVHVIFENLDENVKIALRNAIFHDLVITGKSICCALVTGLVGQFMNDHNTIGALSSQLREVCPDFYSPEDLICAQANELLIQAKTSPPTKRDEPLNEALKLFLQIAHSVNLTLVCQQLQAVHYFDGIVELCVKAAKLRDEQNLAIRIYHSPEGIEDPDVDPAFKNAYLARMDSYKCIIDMFNDLLVAAESHPQAPSVPTQPGPPQLNNLPNSTIISSLTPKNAQIYAEKALQTALKSSDELLHITIYDWLLSRHMIEQITRIESPYIEKFLIRASEVEDINPSANNLLINDLLWQWYERNNKHLSAAEVLIKLAEKFGNDRNLVRRIELLSRATVHAKSLTSVVANINQVNCGQLLNELEDKLQVSDH